MVGGINGALCFIFSLKSKSIEQGLQDAEEAKEDAMNLVVQYLRRKTRVLLRALELYWSMLGIHQEVSVVV